MNTSTPLLGICGGLEAGPAAERSGADFLEVSVQGFLVPGDEDEARFAAQLAEAAKMRCPVSKANLFLPGSLPCVGPAVDSAALLAYARRAFERARRAGIRCIVFGSGAARTVPAGFAVERAREQFVGWLQTIAPLAADADVTVVVEPLRAQECNFINTLAEGAEMVEACGHPGVRLLGDTFHMGFSGEGPDTVRRFGKILRHFHVAEYPSRRPPGADGQSCREYFEALREVGYTGGVSVECRWENIDVEAGPALAHLRRDLAAAGYAVGPGIAS